MKCKVPAGLLLLIVCFSALTAAADAVSLTLTPANTTTPTGSIVTLTATLTNANTGGPVAGESVTIELVSGPGTIPFGPFNLTTSSSGQVSATLTSLVTGVDDWHAFCTACNGGTTLFSNDAFITWTASTPAPEPSSMLLLASGALGFIRTRRRRQG